MRRHSLLTKRSRRKACARDGFTLIEMLVATGLVVLMLLLFARIFGDTVAVMRKQQALVQNDQRARNIDTVLRNDLNKMTYRQPSTPGVAGIVPLSANWPVDPNQQGYFYYSENETTNPLDDVLQFTVMQTIRVRDKDVATIRGRGQQLGRPFTSGQPFPDDNVNNTADDADLGQDADLNQPDYDDGTVGDDLGQSVAAEVSYFVRNGNLYRRVLLIRDTQTPVDMNLKFPGAGFPSPPAVYSAQPGIGVNGSSMYTNASGNQRLADRKFMRLDASSGEAIPVYSDYTAALDVNGTTPGLVDFWNDFDYSAFNQWNDVNNNNALDAFPTDRYELTFNGIESLMNNPGGAEYALAMPQHRFGHRPGLESMLLSDPRKQFGGQPMEFLLLALTAGAGVAQSNATVNSSTNFGYIGRFTHCETSSSNSNSSTRFAYPGVMAGLDPAPESTGAVNPFLSNYGNGWDADGDGIVDAFANGPRTGEDLLISNVESFDVEVWDDGFVEFDVNGNGSLDSFETNSQALTAFGALPRSFAALPGIWTDLGHDTFHPAMTTSPFQSGLGYFRLSNNQNFTYGPRNIAPAAAVPIFNRIYDTWHPRADVGAYGPVRNLRSGDAPYALYKIGGPSGVGSGVVGSVWRSGWPMLAGHYVFPGVAEDPNYNGTIDTGEIDMAGNPTTDGNGNNALDPPETDANGNSYVDHNEDLNHDGIVDDNIMDAGVDLDGDMLPDEDKNGDGHVGNSHQDDWSYYYKPIGYRDINIDGDGNPNTTANEPYLSGGKQPEWLRKPGHVIYDGNVIWKCFDNRVPLQMIRITIRYRDPASGAPRQVSVVHSFVD